MDKNEKIINRAKEYILVAIDGRMLIEEKNMKLNKDEHDWYEVYNASIKLEVYRSMKPLVKQALSALIFNLKHGSERI